MRKAGVERFLVIPLYPQYAASSSATAFDAVFEVLERMRNMPDVRTVRHFYNDMGYIKALAQNVREHWQHHGRAQKLVMSFHGVPRFTVDKGDPYRDECLQTGQLLARELGLKQDEYVMAFQSRFGRTEWIKPYVSEVFTELGKAKIRQIDVICPGFAADCLETLEEIAMEGKETFLTAGGGEYRYIPCLNESPAWITALADITLNNLAGWIGYCPDTTKQPQALGEP
jgi:ferrochelatase